MRFQVRLFTSHNDLAERNAKMNWGLQRLRKSVKCLDCHFLVKQWMGHRPEHWTQNDIQNLAPIVSPKAVVRYRSYCFKQFWDQDAGANVAEEVQEARRPSSCFFLKRTEGTTLEGGQSRYERNRRTWEAGKSWAGLALTFLTLTVATITLVVTCSD